MFSDNNNTSNSNSNSNNDPDSPTLAPPEVAGVIRANTGFVTFERKLIEDGVQKASKLKERCKALCVVENTNYAVYARCSRKIDFIKEDAKKKIKGNKDYCSVHRVLSGLVTEAYEGKYLGDEPADAPAIPNELVNKRPELMARRDKLRDAYLYRSTYTFLFKNKRVDLALSDMGHEHYTESLFTKVTLLNERIHELKEVKIKPKSDSPQEEISTVTVGGVTVGVPTSKSGMYGQTSDPKKKEENKDKNKNRRRYKKRGEKPKEEQGKGEEKEDLDELIKKVKEADEEVKEETVKKIAEGKTSLRSVLESAIKKEDDPKQKTEQAVENKYEIIMKVMETLKIKDKSENKTDPRVLEIVDEFLRSDDFLQFTGVFTDYLENLAKFAETLGNQAKNYSPNEDITHSGIYVPFVNEPDYMNGPSAVGEIAFNGHMADYVKLCERLRGEVINLFVKIIPKKVESSTNLNVTNEDKEHLLKILGYDYDSMNFGRHVLDVVKYEKKMKEDITVWERYGDILVDVLKKSVGLLKLGNITKNAAWKPRETEASKIIFELTDAVLKRQSIITIFNFILAALPVASMLLGEHCTYMTLNLYVIDFLKRAFNQVSKLTEGPPSLGDDLEKSIKERILGTLERTKFFAVHMESNLPKSREDLERSFAYRRVHADELDTDETGVEEEYINKLIDMTGPAVIMLSEIIKGGKSRVRKDLVWVEHYKIFIRCAQGMYNVFKKGYISSAPWIITFTEAYGRNIVKATLLLYKLLNDIDVTIIPTQIQCKK